MNPHFWNVWPNLTSNLHTSLPTVRALGSYGRQHRPRAKSSVRVQKTCITRQRENSQRSHWELNLGQNPEKESFWPLGYQDTIRCYLCHQAEKRLLIPKEKHDRKREHDRTRVLAFEHVLRRGGVPPSYLPRKGRGHRPGKVSIFIIESLFPVFSRLLISIHFLFSVWVLILGVQGSGLYGLV